MTFDPDAEFTRGSDLEQVPVDAEFTLGNDLEQVPVDDPAPSLRYTTLDHFVRDFLVEALWVDVASSSRIWCPQWWRHAGAIIRLEALHRSFEELRKDPGVGMSSWLRDHADYHLAILMEPNGPFKGCSIKGHDSERERFMPAEAPPPGFFTEDD